jgi:hypothetical protein
MCEQKRKQGRDALLGIVHAIQVRPTTEWPDIGQIRRSITSMSTLNAGGVELPLIEIAPSATEASFRWVQGCFSLLYNRYLDDRKTHIEFPPVPSFVGSKPSDERAVLNTSRIVLDALREAEQSHCRDRIVAWDKSVEFNAVWIKGVKVKGLAFCCWELVYPRVFEWSQSVVGRDVPWHGWFAAPKPRDAASLDLSSR